MEFSPFNKVVKLCLQGMNLQEKMNAEQAGEIFLQAWNESSNDFEKFLSAYYIAGNQTIVFDKLHWLETALQHALKVGDVAANSALPMLYREISKCYDQLIEVGKAKWNADLAITSQNILADNGPFYHGTKADLKVGDLLLPGGNSNYSSDLKMNHIYFTALVNGAGLAAALAKGDGREKVYLVEPTGEYENDPNLTDKKFPGNPTRSYRSEAPLKILGEVSDWEKHAYEQIQKFREKVDENRGEIIN